METVISTHNLTKYYGTRKVVDSLTLAVPKGCVYGFLGRNGAGKSTTIKMLMGLVHPDRGGSEVLGEDSMKLTPATKARVAYMAEGHPLIAWMNVGQLARFQSGFYPTWNQQYFEQLVDYFSLPGKLKIRHLSRGQRAQVSLALAVATDPELLILDDPTLGLDTVVRRELLESLIEIIQRKGRTIFFSSHILGDVERVADRIGILVDGILRVDCPTERFKQSLRKVVLEFSGPPPPFSDCRGLVGSRRLEHRLELVIANYNGEHHALLETLNPKQIEEVEMNLEDAFIEYTRGDYRPMPTLTKEERHVVDPV
ncbi:MAG: ABC transporter ATP-binding protein [Candidatus Omnitrophica bacterium]|nr:ABC transporter ATP-binding protein [Candidatus Omnitrophota bacterium]